MTKTKNQEELSKKIFSMAQKELKNLEGVQKLREKSGQEIEDDPNYREPLSLDTTRVVNILLSWGGPSDGFKLRFDKDGELVSGCYWYADWGTYAEEELSSEQCELVYSVYMYSDSQSFFDNS